jgi:hypothetical protein
LLDHFAAVEGEVNAAGIADGSVEGAEDQRGAREVDGLEDEGVDDLHERGLNGFLVFKQRDVMEPRVGRTFDGAEHALMEVAELLSAESRGATTDSGDHDVGANFDVRLSWHSCPIRIGPIGIDRIVFGSIVFELIVFESIVFGSVGIGLIKLGLIELDPINNFLVVAS